MMAPPVVVLKCRECGASRPVGYEAADHSRLDGCDGCLDFYCNACRRFIAAAKCATCESHALEAEKQRLRERKERIEQLLCMPGVSHAYSSLRRWPWFERASGDFVARGGIARQQKLHLAIVAGLAGLTLCAPAWLRVVLWSLITLSVLFVLCSRTLPDHCPPDV